MREWLINLRKLQGMTQKDVAKLSFIDRSFYAQLENGNRNPSIAVAKNIAHTLKFNPSAFFIDELNDPFNIALTDTPIIIAHCDLDLRYTWIFNPHLDFNPNDVIGKLDNELARNKGTENLMKLKQAVIDQKTPIIEMITFPLSDKDHIYHVYGKPLYNGENSIIGVATVSTDLTTLLNQKLYKE
ncbi:helix-turn-helix domain-containing protein [Bacillus sp. BGMRC 2118]|nr:helix-turn-helix domain-containing protein [Bacillus sp. BGMRC 2118]